MFKELSLLCLNTMGNLDAYLSNNNNNTTNLTSQTYTLTVR